MRYNAICNLELNAVSCDLPYAKRQELVDLQIRNLTPDLAYDNAMRNLANIRGQIVASFSIFPESLQKAFLDSNICGIIIVDSNHYTGDLLEVIQQPNHYLGISNIQKSVEHNLDKVIAVARTNKGKIFSRLCQHLETIGIFSTSIGGLSEVALLSELGLLSFGGAVIGDNLLEKDEINLLVQNNFSCICSSIANGEMGFDFPNLYTLITRKLPICLGTDNLYSNNFDLQKETHFSHLLTKSQMRENFYSYYEFDKYLQQNARDLFSR